MQQMPAIQLEQMGKIKLMNRTDTKFLTNKEGLMKVLELARDDYFVQEIKGKRIARYRTTYWDTDDHDFYVMHHNGHKPRLKVRVRTYEDSQGLTYLEIKRKDNHGKTKKRRTEVKSQTEVIESGGDTYLLEQTGIHIDTLHPCLQNYFKRITLVNKGKTERLTIDYDIQYTNFETHKTADSGNLVIIELKRDGLVFSPIKEILTELRIRPHGYSKYIFGSFLTNDNLKSNLIKPKYAEIKKLL
ncbi:MAG TPA: VTC domain-containing protein [Prevotellaceae bacterium]|nr:VTC domain-containing protein [Prevotellaceae bacterium]